MGGGVLAGCGGCGGGAGEGAGGSVSCSSRASPVRVRSPAGATYFLGRPLRRLDDLLVADWLRGGGGVTVCCTPDEVT